MIKFIKSAKYKDDFPKTNREVVFVGRSNVGKSSLINSLFGKVAYVGKTPGKTRLLNFFNVDDVLTICDAPGYGYAKRNEAEIIEFGEIMEGYFKNRIVNLCLFIIDIRRIPNEDDVDMLNYLRDRNIRTIVVANKCDKLNKNDIKKSVSSISDILEVPPNKIICVSTLSKLNIDFLKSIIIEK